MANFSSVKSSKLSKLLGPNFKHDCYELCFTGGASQCRHMGN